MKRAYIPQDCDQQGRLSPTLELGHAEELQRERMGPMHGWERGLLRLSNSKAGGVIALLVLMCLLKACGGL